MSSVFVLAGTEEVSLCGPVTMNTVHTFIPAKPFQTSICQISLISHIVLVCVGLCTKVLYSEFSPQRGKKRWWNVAEE